MRISEDGRVSVTYDPNTGDDIGDRDYNDARYVNVGEAINGDLITDNTIDSSEIQNGTLTAADLANNSVASAEIVNGTIVNADISNTAAIAGTKISPNFGAQNIVTTGTVT